MLSPTSAALLIDFYKTSHADQYPKGTTLIYSNFTARSGKHSPVKTGYENDTVFFGLTIAVNSLVEIWDKTFFNIPKATAIGNVERIFKRSQTGLQLIPRLEALHDLGYLPMRLYALPEGSRVPIGVPYFTIENTHPDFFWITNYLETTISNMLWKPCTSATIAFYFRKLLERYAVKTGTDLGFIKFQGHDFSYRGMAGFDDAVLSGAGHLLSFVGTDTVPAIDILTQYYDCNEEAIIGCSVPATEHSVVSAGSKESEFETLKRLLTEVHPNGILSSVSDTWNLWKVLTEYLPLLKNIIVDRDGKLVIRPDSGNPADILCGSVMVWDFDKDTDGIISIKDAVLATYDLDVCDLEEIAPGESEIISYFKYQNKTYSVTHSIRGAAEGYEGIISVVENKTSEPIEVVLTPEQKGAIQCLWELFGGTTTSTGHKMLHPKIGTIYGDGINIKVAEEILYRLDQNNFASGNTVFGNGSYMYVFVTRDTFGYAMKATMAVIDGEERAIFKDPITDTGGKKSARGWLKVIKDENGKFKLLDNQETAHQADDEMKLFYNPVIDAKCLEIMTHDFGSLTEIRTRLHGTSF